MCCGLCSFVICSSHWVSTLTLPVHWWTLCNVHTCHVCSWSLLQIINAGVKILARCDHPNTSCAFRLCQEARDMYCCTCGLHACTVHQTLGKKKPRVWHTRLGCHGFLEKKKATLNATSPSWASFRSPRTVINTKAMLPRELAKGPFTLRGGCYESSSWLVESPQLRY